ncbi:MAG: hypothetical protein OXG44_07940 [Gammaproteobacteria bacterium]|nr:hypothetical protein [Gammaproteobacteria bacterium]MDE0191219.1 hypothetical protein [Gammaproteobacteria bacterium]
MRNVVEFSLGNVLATGARLYLRNLAVFLPASLVAFAPAFAFVAVELDDVAVFEFSWGSWGLDNREIASLLGGVWLQTGLAVGVMNRLEGGYFDPGETVAESVRSLLRFAHVGLALGALVLVGLSALVVPGLVLATMLWVAVPLAVVERRGLSYALQRSFKLTAGYRGRILGLVLVLLVIALVFDFVFAVAVFAVARGVVGIGVVPPDVVLQVSGVLAWGLAGSVAAVCYHDLRVLKEGASAKSIVRVFE